MGMGLGAPGGFALLGFWEVNGLVWDLQGYFPLQWAALNNQVSIVSSLIEVSGL